MPRSLAYTAGRNLNITELYLDPIPFDGWNPARTLGSKDINWEGLLEGCGTDSRLLEGVTVDLRAIEGVALIGLLVHAIKIFYDAAIDREHLPDVRGLIERLRKMREAARLLSVLARGDDRESEPAETPDRFDGTRGRDSTAEDYTPLINISPALHPVLHNALDIARNEIELSTPPQGEHAGRRRQEVSAFFETLGGYLTVLDKAIEQAEIADPGGEPVSNRPAGNARRWARSRLLLVWRDVIGEKIELNLTRTRKRVKLDTPEPGPCLRFVIDALEHIDPVGPHGYSGLRTDLRRLATKLPQKNFLLGGV